MKILRNSINHLKYIYFHWRYWHTLYRNMVNQVKAAGGKDEQNSPNIKKPGIAFSFDDSYRIWDWYKFGKDLFEYYDIKATFNINGTRPFEKNKEHTQKEIDMLIELQSKGHEIGNHSFTHKKATEYTRKYGLDKWINDEIVALNNWMAKQSHSVTKEKFKKSVSFAFPNFLYDDDIIFALTPHHFKIVRGHLDKDNLISFGHTGFAPSICLDSYYSYNMYYIKKIMKLAKSTGKNLILTCHSILPKDANGNKNDKAENPMKRREWSVTPAVINSIINEARKMGLEFYTTSEIAGVATFIDKNFEKEVRKLITNPNAKWIKISELIEIKELNISNRGISNLDGIQYFLNLEKLNISNNNIKDLKLLKKLPKLKEIKKDNIPISNFTIASFIFIILELLPCIEFAI